MTSCQSYASDGISKNERFKTPDLNQIYENLFEKHIRKLNIPSENDYRAEVSFWVEIDQVDQIHLVDRIFHMYRIDMRAFYQTKFFENDCKNSFR